MQPIELLEQGRILRKQDRAGAIACFEEASQTAKSINDETAFVAATIELALELVSTTQPLALAKAQELLAIAVSSSDRQAMAYVGQGLINLKQGNYPQALTHFQTALQSYDQDPEGLALVDAAFGEYYAVIGDFKNALFHIQRSRQHVDHSQRLEQLGRLYYQFDLYDQAKEYFEQSLDLAINTEDKYLQMQAFSGLAQVAIAYRQWDTAIMIINEVLEQIDEELDLEQTAYLYQSLAEALMGKEKISEAQVCIEQEAIPRFEKLQNPYGLAQSHLTLSKVLKWQLANGIDDPNPDAIEAVADEFMDVLLELEPLGAYQARAKTLYELAGLYTICHDSRTRYQFQGKSLRALESALTLLEQVGHDYPDLVNKIELAINELMG